MKSNAIPRCASDHKQCFLAVRLHTLTQCSLYEKLTGGIDFSKALVTVCLPAPVWRSLQSVPLPRRALVAITEKYFSPTYFDKALTGAQVDQEVLKEFVSHKLPSLAAHFSEVDIELSTVTLNWFLAIFYDIVPFQVSESYTARFSV